MTDSAREVLHYCKLAIDELKKTDFNENELWKLRWVTAVALLRAVLHVHIKKTRKELSNSVTYKEFWRKKKNEWIFSEFIDKERNLLLKEFDFERISKQAFILTTEEGVMLCSESGIRLMTEDIIIIRHINKPVYELLDYACKWLEDYLNEADVIFTVEETE